MSIFDKINERDEHDKRYNNYLKEGGHVNIQFKSEETYKGTNIQIEGELSATTHEIRALIHSLINALSDRENVSVVDIYTELSIKHLLRNGKL